ncbi:MAG TPA: hypothetical protein VLF69_00335 [Candidatus Saccharimonadales bacterium]|nr:hypothetical protein [Candidatus Saccharimonadales bacterium]
MISEQTKQELDRLHSVQKDYRPTASVAANLQTKTILMFVGATCVGKNTVMQTVAELNPDFRVTGNRTSRAPRTDDDHSRYTYYQNSDEGLRRVLDEIKKGKVVQYAIHQYSHQIYATTIADYPGIYNLADVLSSAVHNFRQLGFRQAIAISVVAEPTVWRQRFEARFPAGHSDRQARRDEAIESLTWSLAQPDGNGEHFWVQNIDGQPEIAAQAVIDIATTGTGQGAPEARAWAEACLALAQSIQI